MLDRLNCGLYTFIVESHFTGMYKQLNMNMSVGWGNGYVLLPKEHPYYDVNYDDIHVYVHGGLTFGSIFNAEEFLEWVGNKEIDGDLNKENYKDLDGYYMIGFDTAHFNDDKYNCPKEYVLSEANKLLEYCLDDSVESIRKYKYKYLRKKKLKSINGVKG